VKRILLRTGKDPRQPFNPYESLDRDTFGGNSGNILFASGAHKLLSTDNATVDVGGLGLHPRAAARINDEYDVVVLPMANALRSSYAPQLETLANFIERLKIPVVLLSIGAQSGPDGTFKNLSKIETVSKRLFAAILERSSRITVRGEYTAEYVRGLGFSDVTVIGCPSLTLAGPAHTIRPFESKDRPRVAYNVQVSKDLGGALVDHIETNTDATYIPQDALTLEMMLWGGPDPYPGDRDHRLPLAATHRQFVENRARFMVDASVWIDYLRDFDLAIGPRIHGSVSALLAGTPAIVLSHDSRTEELASYHQIPHTKPAETPTVERIDDIVDRLDFAPFNAGQAERVQRVVDFLHENDLTTIYDVGQEDALKHYDRQLGGAELPGPIGVAWAELSDDSRNRIAWLRARDKSRAQETASLRREIAAIKRVFSSIK
jgi:hypothetical protein